ncbi:MAG: hypothetical protein OSA97_04540 [Nevskia sp.]|nr:hypothetical protein [Nevskia sp.]
MLDHGLPPRDVREADCTDHAVPDRKRRRRFKALMQKRIRRTSRRGSVIAATMGLLDLQQPGRARCSGASRTRQYSNRQHGRRDEAMAGSSAHDGCIGPIVPIAAAAPSALLESQHKDGETPRFYRENAWYGSCAPPGPRRLPCRRSCVTENRRRHLFDLTAGGLLTMLHITC